MVISTFDIIILPPGLKRRLAARMAAALNSRAALISMDMVIIIDGGWTPP